MNWRRFMDHVRVCGVCLLLLIVATALPMDVLAQTPQAATDSGAQADNAGGATPTISESSPSKGTAQGESASAEKLLKRNSGLKPLKRATVSAPAAVETAPTVQSTPTPVPVTKAEEAPAATQAVTPKVSAAPAVETKTEESPVATQAQTPKASAASAAVEASPQSAGSSQNTSQNEVTVTPPASVTPVNATEQAVSVSSNETPAAENVSQNESPNASENQAATTEKEAAPEAEAMTDRIWRQGISPDEYTWTPNTFSGFFYDLKDDVGTEKLSVRIHKSGGDYSRSIDEGDLRYNSDVQKLEYKYSSWGSYQVMGFMADKYFAGYLENDIIDNPRSLINDGQLRKVLIDSDDEQTLTSGSVLPMEEGYELRIREVDINGNKVFLSLAKNGEVVDSKVVSPDSLRSATYKYEVEVAGEKTPIIMAHISNVFASAESSLATIDGLFQISDNYSSVEDGDKYDKMKVISVSDSGIEMENEDALTLKKGGIAKIFGEVGFQTADADELRFAPIVERTGTYDVRGTVINPSNTSEFTWTPYNFEGFYYDIDDDVGTESLNAKITRGSRIEEKDLTYQTSPQPVKFKFKDWGKYDVIGFMADKYFAGYNNATVFTDVASVINEGELRKILIDSDDSETIAGGSVLALKDGYELRIKEVDLNGNKVYLSLAKNGEDVDSKVVAPSGDAKDRTSNYMYKVNIGSEKDVPIIVAHIQSVFRGTETDLATVDGLFQVSDTPESVEEGEVHGRMKVETLGDEGITMKNDGSISLGRGRTIEIMENLRLEVADNSKRLTAPIATKTSEGEALNLSVPEAIVNQAVVFKARSGATAVGGVQILVNGTTIGATDATGSISYTPHSTGTSEVIARKSGYNDVKANLVVRTASEASALAAAQAANATMANQLAINAPTEVTRSENFLITVIGGVNQSPIENASVSFDDQSIGYTSAQGTLTFSTNETGEHSIKAEKEGFSPATKSITVMSPIAVQSLNAPEKASVGQEIKITAGVRNTGTENDTRRLDLKLNNSIVESENVTVKAGENATAAFSYKLNSTGLHRFSLDSQSVSVNVEKAQTNSWLIALIIVLLIVIGAGYYLHTTGELDNIKKKLHDTLQGRK
jgi:S-layer protein (TIGR01567 family)